MRLRLTRRARRRIRSALLRATRTFLQAFLSTVTAAPLLDVHIATLKDAYDRTSGLATSWQLVAAMP